MPGPSFNQLFGGSVIYPAQPTFIALPLTTNVVLDWPTEIAPAGTPVVADIIEVNAASPGLTISLSDATQSSQGYTALFNNVGSNTFTVLDTLGNVLMSVTSGQAWQIYLADNSTVQGLWRVFQYGAGVSSANAAALAGAGLKAITTTLNERIVIQTKSANYPAVSGDRASCLEWTGGSGGIFTIDPVGLGSDWFCLIKNNGTGNLNVTPASGTIDGAATLIFAPENSAFVVSDGTNLITIGFGQAVNTIFDFISIDVSGTGNYVLASAQLNRVSYKFVGGLTGASNIIVPNTVQQYWCDNETTGAFTLTVKTLAGTGVTINQGQRNILYCDGTNVVAAVTFGSSGFADGSAAAPSINFASSPSTGFYYGGLGIIGFATNGVSRGTIDGNGNWTIAPPSGPAAVSFMVNGNSAGATVTQKIQSSFSSGSITPLLSLVSTAANGFATLSIAGNNGTPGTTDVAIFQNGTNGDGTLINRNNNSKLNITTTGAASFVNVNPNGVTSLQITPTAISGLGPTAAALVDMTPDTGTFSGSVTGMTSVVSYPCVWTRIGKLVMLAIGGVSGTSNANTLTMTGIPAEIQPATLTPRISLDTPVIYDNGSLINTSATAEVAISGGTFTFLKNGLSTGWTAAGTKGISVGATILISYLLN